MADEDAAAQDDTDAELEAIAERYRSHRARMRRAVVGAILVTVVIGGGLMAIVPVLWPRGGVQRRASGQVTRTVGIAEIQMSLGGLSVLGGFMTFALLRPDDDPNDIR